MSSSGLPPKIRSSLRAEMMGAHSQHMHDIKSNVANSNNILRHSAVRMVDEGSPANARAVDKILRLPG